ncbi:feruloyl-CoA synthase [Halomonas heilongjiangensis]|uniref:Feruloyl-CoA synthase n=1 Tax=Halomonas heilongjiangensis TaxID=1387883 RepID=A0A2N7TGY9_9GAMM|nr:feruloyl-CoA synthase [Halomonas heilongjiangensis]PMR67450.1 feruloyl-CoA synthase [Halomonas heilongjiangensis]PXX87107.1 feruloyl-CoA synthase [Halomonas heilongjiangensis]
MTTSTLDQLPAPAFIAPRVRLERRDDGTRLLHSAISLGDDYARCSGEWLEHWAREAPDRVWLAERDARGAWNTLTYGEARRRVIAIAGWLLSQGLSPERPLVILSDNSIEHALLMTAAMHIGVPSCSISPGSSLMSRDHAKLKGQIRLLQPGVVYADPIEPFAPALEAIAGLHDGIVVAGNRSAASEGATPFAELEKGADDAAVMAAFAAITPDTIAKFLFTSGSVGTPKAVPNTQRMLCSNQQAKALLWPTLAERAPVLLDWLPWSHTFGGNHNFNIILRWGGTLYLDDGKPTPELIGKTARNLREVSPTHYFSVPRAYDMLVPLLRDDAELRRAFFQRLQLIFYAAAALPDHLWTELETMARETAGREVLIASSWGSTETAPICTDCHFPAVRSGVIGVPVPGCTLKLVPTAGKLEVRVKGPNVFTGYWKQPELSAKAFDDEGFYMIGDAVRFVDPERPELGLLFDGRVSEDFKLLTGTWVHVGALRMTGLDALKPVAQDIVVTGHDRDEIGFLIVPHLAECRRLCPALPEDAPAASVLSRPEVVERVREAMRALKASGGGSSTYPTRALLLEEPPSMEAGEITDKGYINQRKVLDRRTELVHALYDDTGDPRVITLNTEH